MSLLVPIRPGDQLDHYQIEELTAQSGMASIYRARDLRDGRRVALKVPHFEAESDPLFFDRFQREERIGLALDHPGVVKVFENSDRSRLYMAMEWVDGRLLRQVLTEEKKLAPERAVHIVSRICEALDYIHNRGVVHRDLKPENIMLDAEDRIKLIDFGIAGSAAGRRLTFRGLSSTMGSPDYISPEQVKSKRGDARSDVYALAVMLYEMLTGETPFQGPSPMAVINDRLLNDPRPPRELEPGISPELQEIIYRAMERDPENRYSSARAFAHDLSHQDAVGVAERSELRNWKDRRTVRPKTVLVYALLAMIPIMTFLLLLVAAKRH